MISPQLARRRFVAGAALSLACPSLLLGREGRLFPTPAQSEGPFYPDHLSGELDADLLVIAGRRYDEGETAWVTGRVTDTRGEPISGALVEIWQCDDDGHYRHPRDRGEVDPDFQGFGRVTAGADGSYRFRTIRPAPYPGRTPHIHFKVRRGETDLLTTQLYVEGEPLNQRDGLWRSLGPRERQALTRPFEQAENGWQAWFPIVIDAKA